MLLYIIAPADRELQNKSALESNSKHMTASKADDDDDR